MLHGFLLRLFVHIGIYLFQFVDVYAPTDDEVVALTFGNDLDYMKKIADIAIDYWRKKN